MSNSLFIPLQKLPNNFKEIEEVISDCFLDFGYASPKLARNTLTDKDINFLDEFIMLEGKAPQDSCWITMCETTPEVTGVDGCKYLVGVKTRGNWVFAGIVAYAICQNYGTIVFNDSCELDGQEQYSVDSLRTTLNVLLNSKK